MSRSSSHIAKYQHNLTRIKDIVSKSEGSIEKQIKLSSVQAKRITDEEKALDRAMLAKELGHTEVFEVFFQRAYELGNVSLKDYRDYKLEKLGI